MAMQENHESEQRTMLGQSHCEDIITTRVLMRGTKITLRIGVS